MPLADSIGDEITETFLRGFAKRFAHLVSRLAPAAQASAAQAPLHARIKNARRLRCGLSKASSTASPVS